MPPVHPTVRYAPTVFDSIRTDSVSTFRQLAAICTQSKQIHYFAHTFIGQSNVVYIALNCTAQCSLVNRQKMGKEMGATFREQSNSKAQMLNYCGHCIGAIMC